jgi:hypothetical protein
MGKVDSFRLIPVAYIIFHSLSLVRFVHGGAGMAKVQHCAKYFLFL